MGCTPRRAEDGRAGGYYDWLDRAPTSRERSDTALTATITAVHAASYGTYGARRV